MFKIQHVQDPTCTRKVLKQLIQSEIPDVEFHRPKKVNESERISIKSTRNIAIQQSENASIGDRHEEMKTIFDAAALLRKSINRCKNWVKNCAESDEECCEVGSRAQVQGIFRDGCGCEKGCFEKLNFEVTFDYRLQLAEFSREEKDILLLTKLENMEVRSENVRTRKRSRQRYRYEFQGQLICENAWRCIHDIGK